MARGPAHRRRGRLAVRSSLASRNRSQRVRPSVGIVLGMRLELQLRRHVNAETSTRNILALDGEFEAIEVADCAVGDVQRDVWRRVSLVVVIVLEAVEKAGGRNDVVACAVTLHDSSRFPVEQTADQRLRSAMILVGELNVAHRTRGGIWVDKRRIVALVEVGPLVVNGNLLSSCGDFRKERTLTIRLRRHDLEKLVERILGSFQDVAFELLEAGLDGEDLLEALILLADLLVQPVIDTPAEQVRIMGGFDFASGIERRRILA